MPVISRFSGIIIKMYLRQSEHNPPHIHAICGTVPEYFLLQMVKCLKEIFLPKNSG